VVLHADPWLLVIDKPSGLLSQSGRGPALADAGPARLESAWGPLRLPHRLDRDTSGMYADKTETFAPELGITRAKPFVEWLNANKLRGFIGEMGVPNYAPDAILAMDNLLGYLRENCVPLTYWAAGPWWGKYILSLDVTGGAEQPQLAVLRKHAAMPNRCAALRAPM
jgi:endoglucanase